MCFNDEVRWGWVLVLAALAGCGPRVAGQVDGETDSDSGGGPMTTGLPTVTSVSEDGSSTTPDGPRLDLGDDVDDPELSGLDVLIVIDNSVSMAREQPNVARNVPRIVQTIEQMTDATGDLVHLDTHVMVTTTDFGSPYCAGAGAGGAPVTQGCNARIDEFTLDDQSIPEVCASVCPTDIAPDGNFIAFHGDDNNVPDVPPIDINGDGEDDSSVVQAAACLGAQGIVGCEYESPLESMLQALNPEAEWNRGPDPFLRSGGVLMVIVITDEPDCSPAPEFDEAFWNVNPATGLPEPTSAACWNAGVACVDDNGDQIYEECNATADGPLHPTERYTSYLQTLTDDKLVFFGLVAGVPEVTRHNELPPFEPIEGGLHGLVVRDPLDGDWPMGDLYPDEWAAGRTGAHLLFERGIGPGCMTDDARAYPPVRIPEVCASLDTEDDSKFLHVRCVVESICDPDLYRVAYILGGLFTIVEDLPKG